MVDESGDEVMNPCPECGAEMDCKKLPEFGTPIVGFCPEHGMQPDVDCIVDE
jgi:hypothetical protein